MEKQMLFSAVLRYFHTIVLLQLVTCSSSLPTSSSLGASKSLHTVDELSHPYSSIFSPLLKALSQHGRSRWNQDPRKRMKPEQKYIRYLKEVYKKSLRLQRSLDGSEVHNTIRMIKPQDECLAQNHEETFMQDISYSLDQVRREEQLLKSTLLFILDNDPAAPSDSVCYLIIKEQELSDQCQLCPTTHHSVNFTASTDIRGRRNEVDVTSFLLPLLQVQRKNIHLRINSTCPEKREANGEASKGHIQFTLSSPILLLYLRDTSQIAHHRVTVDAKVDQKLRELETEPRILQKRRWKRESHKSKRVNKNLDFRLPELRPSSQFPTRDCALYDFKVRFSQLKLDQMIVYPQKFNPRYCRGICPNIVGFIYGSPKHTIMQNLIYETLDSSVPRPSCVPSHYSPLSVMIFEKDGSYVYREMEDMVATRCTCR